MNFQVSKQYKYLSEVPEFREHGLPSGYLINKGKIGCGGTSLALEDNRDTIICVPFVSLIKNKLYKYNKTNTQILGVYAEVSDNAIREYISTTKNAKKIICTYDSLSRVTNIVGYNYFLLIDELHLLFQQYAFRNKAISQVLALYKKFKEWAFLTATPIEPELMLEELRDIPTYNIIWENYATITVKAVHCKHVLQSIKTIIGDFLNNKIFGNAHIFINSVDSIANIIKHCNLNNENTRIIFSKNNIKYKNICQGIYNSETTAPVKKINMYTSTCFEGCDLFDKEGKIFIISEGNQATTLYDISTQIRQIAGRIRDSHYTTITHLYSTTRYNPELTFEEYKQLVLTEERNAKSYIAKINKDEELKKGTKESTYLYIYKDTITNNFTFDPNLMKLDIFNFKCLHHTYNLAVNLCSEYQDNNIAVTSITDSSSDLLLKNSKARTTFKQAILEYDSIMSVTINLSLTDKERLQLLMNKYPYIKDAYDILGMDKIEKMKYKTSNIQQYLIKASPKLHNKDKIARLLKPKLREGFFLTRSDIKALLRDIYTSIGITVEPDVNDLKEFAIIKKRRKCINGKEVRGYLIIYIKEH